MLWLGWVPKCKFLVRSFLNDWKSFMMCDMKFPTWFIIVMNLLSSVKVVDGAMLRMASTLLGSGETPLALTMWQEIWGWCSWTCTFFTPGDLSSLSALQSFMLTLVVFLVSTSADDDINQELLSQQQLQSIFLLYERLAEVPRPITSNIFICIVICRTAVVVVCECILRTSYLVLISWRHLFDTLWYNVPMGVQWTRRRVKYACRNKL